MRTTEWKTKNIHTSGKQEKEKEWWEFWKEVVAGAGAVAAGIATRLINSGASGRGFFYLFPSKKEITGRRVDE